MAKTYILNPQNYLYAYINNGDENFQTGRPDLNAELGMNETIVTYPEANPTILKSGDKLIVHRTEIEESHWPELIKSFYDIGCQCVYNTATKKWHRGLKISHIGVNSEGDSISVHVDIRSHKNSTFKLPLKFDWSRYGVIVPDSTEDALRKKKEENQKLQQQLQEKEDIIKGLGKVKYLQSAQDEILKKVECENYELKEQVSSLTRKLQEKDENIHNLGHQLRQKECENYELKGNVTRLKQQLQEKEENFYDLQQQLQEKEDTVKDLKLQLDNQSEQLQREADKNKELQRKLDNVEDLLVDKNRMMEEMERQIKALKEQESTFMQQLQETKNIGRKWGEIQELQQKLTAVMDLLVKVEFQNPVTMKTNFRSCSEIDESIGIYDMPPNKFVISYQPLLTSSKTTYRPQLHIPIEKIRVFTPVDHEIVDSPFPDKICVYTTDEGFHNKDWKFIKATECLTTTMLAFYDGDFDQVSIHGNVVYIPFHRGQTFRSNTHEFFIGLIRGIGLRFMFLY